jgi:hypothetical protein
VESPPSNYPAFLLQLHDCQLLRLRCLLDKMPELHHD